MKKLLTLAAAAALSVGVVVSGAVGAQAQTPPEERDYLVQIGKRPVYASELRRQQEAARQQAARTPAPSSKGRFVQVGKQVVWVEGDRPAPIGASNRRYYAVESQPYVPSSGRFVQRGKAQFWVPNYPQDASIAEKVGSQ